jgi:hypothetical protein
MYLQKTFIRPRGNLRGQHMHHHRYHQVLDQGEANYQQPYYDFSGAQHFASVS